MAPLLKMSALLHGISEARKKWLKTVSVVTLQVFLEAPKSVCSQVEG
jgi:hypothetical protein